MSIFRGNFWLIELLPEWIGEHEEDISTIYHPNGVGSLQISCYSKDSAVTKSDLEDLAQDHINEGAKIADAVSGDFRGMTLAFRVDGKFWQHWFVANSNIALFITYNCNDVHLGKERDYVKQMISTLKTT